MLQFEIKTFEEFKNTLDAGKHVIVSHYADKSVVPTIILYMMFMKNNNGETVFGMMSKDDINQEIIDATLFDYLALTGKTRDGMVVNDVDYDRIGELYKIFTNEKCYIFTTYSNPYID